MTDCGGECTKRGPADKVVCAATTLAQLKALNNGNAGHFNITSSYDASVPHTATVVVQGDQALELACSRVDSGTCSWPTAIQVAGNDVARSSRVFVRLVRLRLWRCCLSKRC